MADSESTRNSTPTEEDPLVVVLGFALAIRALADQLIEYCRQLQER